jgi:ATP-binding cassette subfamily B protein
VGIIFIQGILPLVSLYLMKLIVDSIIPGSSQADFRYVLTLIALAGLVALLVAFARSASSVVNENQSALVSDHVQNILHRIIRSIQLTSLLRSTTWPPLQSRIGGIA